MSIPGIDTWLQTPQGQYVMAWEQSRVDAMVADVFGYNALQFGLPQVDLLGHNRIPLRQKAGESGNVDVLCDLRQLPFSAHSADLIVLPHILEFHDDPHQILREIERVLIPEGQLIIIGFNPLSLWGLRRRLPNCTKDFPWSGDYISVQRMKDWLQLLGFDVDRGNFGCYAPPFEHEQWLERCHFMEAAGDRWWGFAGGIYLIRAVKRVRGMRLIMPTWNQAKVPGKALGAVTQKELHNVANEEIVDIYADGGCRGNPGPGGWGVLMQAGEHRKELWGGEPETTNNRMELTAVIRSLEALRRPMTARIHTDSQYVQKGISEWIHNWKRNGWRTADKKPVKNADLWQILDTLTKQHQISWIWVKGHAGHIGNEHADSLANRGIDELLATQRK